MFQKIKNQFIICVFAFNENLTNDVDYKISFSDGVLQCNYLSSCGFNKEFFIALRKSLRDNGININYVFCKVQEIEKEIIHCI